MEAKKTKILALAVLAMLCAVAIVGAAYAAFNGTAKTYNENNSAVAGNILITNEAWTPIVTGVTEEFNTYTYNGGKAFYFDPEDATVDTTSVTNYTIKSLAAAKEISVKNNTGAPIAGLTVSAKSNAVICNADFVYFVKVTIGGVSGFIQLPATTAYEGVNITLASALNDGSSVTVALELFIGYAANVAIPDTFIGAAVTPIPEPITGYIPAINSALEPIDLNATAFGFEVKEYVPSP